MVAITLSAAVVAPVVARASSTRRAPRAVVRATGLKTVNALPAFKSASVDQKFATLAASTRVSNGRRVVTSASAVTIITEIAAIGPEIAKVATTMFAITLTGLAIGFVLLRVEATIEGTD
jgi:hypothetical protein